MEDNKKLFVVTYAHYYDFAVFTESKVYDDEEKAKTRFNEYLKDVYEQIYTNMVASETFEDWVYYNVNGNELLFSFDNGGFEYYNVHIEETELNKN